MIDCPTSKVDKEKVIFIKLGGLLLDGGYCAHVDEPHGC